MRKRRYNRFATSRLHAPKHFTETIKIRDIVSPANLTTAGQGYNNSITLGALQNYSPLEDVFKQACITGIKLMFIPKYNNYTAPGGTITIPKIFFAEDKTTSGLSPMPTTNDLIQQDNCKIFQSNRMWKHYIKMPRPLYQVLEPTTGGNPIQVQPQSRAWEWVNTEDPDAHQVEWLNSVMNVEMNNSNVGVVVGELWAKVFYAFKEQK